MTKQLEQLEIKLNDLFVKSAPALPKGGKDFLVQFIPYLSLLGGLFNLWAAYNLWYWASKVNHVADVVNRWSETFGVDAVSTNRWSVALWISLAILLATALLYILAYAPLKARKKAGWNLLFYALLLHLAAGVVGVFADSYGYGGGFGGLIGSLIGFVIGGWFIFQIRETYLTKKSRAKKA